MTQRYPTPDEVLAILLSTARYLGSRYGVTINVAKGSAKWIRYKAIAEVISIAIQNGKISTDAVSPLRATGQDLIDLAGQFGVYKRPATKGAGRVTVGVLLPATSTAVPLGYRCTSAYGITYETTALATVSDGDTVPVRAVTAGEDTDLAAGELVTWNSASVAYLDQKATVAVGDIDGGRNEDSEEVLRARLLRRLGFPSVGGNWAQVAEWAEEGSAAVDFAAVYPSARGPASFDVAIMGDADDRVLNSETIAIVDANIRANKPGSADPNTTSVAEEELDIIVNISAPLPRNAGGAGGGFVDAEPYPSDADSAFANVTAVGAATLTVDSTSADLPVVGKRIAIWDATNEAMLLFSITSVAGSSGAYVLGVDNIDGLTNVAVGAYVSAQMVNIADYAATLVSAVESLGPGEKSDDVDVLTWARRKPGPDQERPYTLTSRQLTTLENAYTEISNINYAARYATGTTTTQKTPSVPSVVTLPPKILKAKHISFRYQA